MTDPAKIAGSLTGAEPAPAVMLLEGAQDAIEALKLLRLGAMKSDATAIELIDAHIDELEYAVAAYLKEQKG